MSTTTAEIDAVTARTIVRVLAEVLTDLPWEQATDIELVGFILTFDLVVSRLQPHIGLDAVAHPPWLTEFIQGNHERAEMIRSRFAPDSLPPRRLPR